MRSLVSLAVLFAAVSSAPASADLKYFFCFTPVPETGYLYVSDRQDIGPIPERAGYSQEFTDLLRHRRHIGDNRQSYCNMRSTVAEIDRDREDLRVNCRVCGDAKNFVHVIWNRAGGDMEEGSRHQAELAEAMNQPGGSGILPDQGQGQDGAGGTDKDGDKKKPPEKVPDEIAAPLPQIYNIPWGRTFAQIHTQFFACKNEIRVSYSLIPPYPNVTQMKFSGLVFGPPNTPSRRLFDLAAKPVLGHKLCCECQTRYVAPLSDYESQLVSGTFTDGTTIWSRADMIHHLLGRFSIWGIEHVPYP